MTYPWIAGDQLNNNDLNAVVGFTGDGSDGDVTISSNTTLTRDMYYKNLTINTSFILSPAGYRIFVQNILTNNGTIRNNGTVGTIGSNGSGGVAGGGGAGGAGGTGNNILAGTNGSSGGAGGDGSSGAAGTAGTNGSSVGASLGSNGAIGGAGGGGSGAGSPSAPSPVGKN